ncbi:phosphatidylglycerophosphatase A [Amylibacter sp.]|nr:phosphatidylglycerophosphatase A [Amylibacter sp.]
MMRLISTWFYIGLLKPAPGTWGSLGSLPFIYVFLLLNFTIWHLMTLCILIFFLGWWATFIETRNIKEHDPAEIVIDEVVGQWITFSPLFLILSNIKFNTSISENTIFINADSSVYSMQIIYIFICAFALFRFFDILKPWPISWADQISSPFGVMFDDVLAGLYAALSLSIILFFGFTL